MRRLNAHSRAFYRQLDQYLKVGSLPDSIRDSVSSILGEIERGGLKAALELTERFDHVRLTGRSVRVSAKSLHEAPGQLTSGERRAIREAIRSVRDFHRRSIPREWRARNLHGAVVGERFYPLRRVGLYIPGGSVPLVSTVVMTATLAKLAGCTEICAFTPPGRPDGQVEPALLAALHLSGVNEVYRIGGAQAVGLMAFGGGSIEAVDKIFGPGNAYVTEAKRQLFGRVGVDLLPGPSEAMAIADEGADPAHVAADLLAQAEHGSGRERVFLVSVSAEMIDAVLVEAEKQMPALRHVEAIREVWLNRAVAIAVPSLQSAAEIANRVAPEHLELHVRKGSLPLLLRSIRTAGAILAGYETPTVLGDFVAGPSHVLPTGGSGRFLSGLRLEDFYRRSSLVQYNRQALRRAAPAVAAFARMEQLDAHGRSLVGRLEAPEAVLPVVETRKARRKKVSPAPGRKVSKAKATRTRGKRSRGDRKA